MKTFKLYIPKLEIFDKYWESSGGIIQRVDKKKKYYDSEGYYVWYSDFFEDCSKKYYDVVEGVSVSICLPKIGTWFISKKFIKFCNKYNAMEVLNKNLKKIGE